jgi:hypothetical protein
MKQTKTNKMREEFLGNCEKTNNKHYKKIIANAQITTKTCQTKKNKIQHHNTT